VSGRGDAFAGSRQVPRHRFHPRGLPDPAVGWCLLLRQGTLAANSGVLRPLPSYGEDRASRPPPLQHRAPIRVAWGADHSTLPLTSVQPGSLRRGPFQSQVEPFWGQVRGHLDLVWLQFGLAAPGRTYGPLYVTTIAVVAQRRTMVCSQPLDRSGRSRAPWAPPPAPGSQIRRAFPSPGGTFESSGVVGVSPALAGSRPIAFVLAESQAVDVGLMHRP